MHLASLLESLVSPSLRTSNVKIVQEIPLPAFSRGGSALVRSTHLQKHSSTSPEALIFKNCLRVLRLEFGQLPILSFRSHLMLSVIRIDLIGTFRPRSIITQTFSSRFSWLINPHPSSVCFRRSPRFREKDGKMCGGKK